MQILGGLGSGEEPPERAGGVLGGGGKPILRGSS